ncbi:gliding motility protein [Pedobacter sp. SYP-B3415]|uniref:type IX secretion system periplasmic lipoprotein PorW/SprE n=1 Tax=Pedobacter sp. SYP-B3415 TaxID=2496641 RepID=UPI00101BD3E8|nr:gliding motility protein [Pedobacter sp. SYP-B3415]
MQNLTARYNYIYNSKVLLDDYSNTQLATQPENYAEILPVYPGPPPLQIDALALPGQNVKALDELIVKAKAIITDKSYSNYIDDAYLLLGKAYYYKSDYFISFEYFDYAARTYQSNLPVFLEANTWAARTQLQLGRSSQASVLLDSVKKRLPLAKNKKAAPLATLAQFEINRKNYAAALDFLRQAMKQRPSKQERIRWNYICAQLSERLGHPAQAYKYYTLVKNSNAPFELYFNADLNRLRIGLAGISNLSEKEKRLLNLLRDDKNLDFSDQVYYQIAELFRDAGQQSEAERYYRLSARLSSQNNYQKGLSYLRIADLNFNQASDYIRAKLYYDSAVVSLPPTFPEYEIISKKALNLQYLSSRYQTIARQDTLQMLAALPAPARQTRIAALVKKNQETVEQPAVQGGSNLSNPDQPFPASAVATGSNFYFNNPAAISRGRTDFIRRFGNRPLTDNWRQQQRSSAQSSTAAVNQGLNLPAGTAAGNPALAAEATEIRAYTDSLPLTADQLAASNKKIADALFQLGSFYQQVLTDTTQTIATYEMLLKRFPQNEYLPVVYYSLYLAYQGRDQQQAENYKQKLLRAYPSTLYARILSDPSFLTENAERDRKINQDYDAVFALYDKGDYQAVRAASDKILQQTGANFLAPQYAYLRAIAIGKTQHVDSLINAFNAVVMRFPEDKVITPLVKEHLAYIQLHLPEFSRRQVALTDFDPNEPHFLARSAAPGTVTGKPAGTTRPPAVAVVPVRPETGKPVAAAPVAPAKEPPAASPPDTSTRVVSRPPVRPPAGQQPAKPNPQAVFSKAAASGIFYFVIRVADPSLVLSSSRFGIGQFNRGNYAAANLRHQLVQLPADQLIYIGNFSSFADAKAYSAAMVPLLRSVMKVPADRYEHFVISRENFDLLKNADLIEAYLEFYKNNF